MTDKFDVAVLGTGLFGAALAFHLASNGSTRVIALEARTSPPYPSATSASAGILSLQGWDPWDLALVRESLGEYRRLAGEEGALPLRQDGGLRVARTDEGARWLERVHRALVSEGIDARWAASGELRDLLPPADLSDARAALLTPEDATIASPELRGAYLRAASRGGARLVSLPQPVAVGRGPDGSWSLGEPVSASADSLAIACGAWSKPLLTSLGHPLPLAPFRAQALRLRPRPLTGPFPTLHDLDWNVYVRPGFLGRLVVGDGTGTREEDPFRWNPDGDAAFVDHALDAVRGVFDGFDAVRPEAAWAGLCVASPDRFPLVGRVPGARGLYVASGFNGFGTMRAGGLARRLAEAIRTGRWEALEPADPLRLPLPPRPFDPRPEFPLEAGEPDGSPARKSPGGQEPLAAWHGGPRAEVRYRVLRSPEEIDAVCWTPLSEWFDPFLPLFAKDAVRTGGHAEVAEEEGVVRGLRLLGSSEGVGSGFTRERRIAERYLTEMEAAGLYLEEAWAPGGERVEILAADLRDWEPRERLRNAVRIARPGDLPAIRRLMREELGTGVDPWLASLPRREETAFVCEIEGRIAGMSWLSRVGAFARGHSFVVHPRYRGLGIGTDLLTARMLWLQKTGGRQVVSEIYDGNRASRTAAERAGMALVGSMVHYRPAAKTLGGRPTSASPRTSGTS
jgi:sarcosine oxidase, subunit beta